MKTKIIVIVGPTAVGKTALSIESRLGRQGNERNRKTHNCDIKDFQAFDIKPEEVKALPAINLQLRLTSRVPDDKYFRKKE